MENGDYVAHQENILKTQKGFYLDHEPYTFVKIFELRLVSQSFLG